MDALGALGLASNIVQFVDFTLKIYDKTRQVIRSAHGATQFNLELEQSCLRLEDFNSKLSPIGLGMNQHPTSLPFGQGDLARRHGDTIRQHVDGVKLIASECTSVCHQLLDVLKDLRHDSSGRLRLPKALVQVIREQFKSKHIAQLEDKLKSLQTPLLLHLTNLLNERQIYATCLLESVASNHERLFSQTKRFDDLKSQLNIMTDGINALTRKLHQQATKQTHIAPGGIEDLEHLLSGLRLSEEGIGKAAKEQEIIQSLNFPEKTSRHERITEAHQKTFEWVFQSHNKPFDTRQHDKKPTELSQGGDILHWLQNGNGVFWITGKPGSGKSTLMKFIAGHNKTRHALNSWAGGKDVVIASHYFWAIGTEKQKSQRGLLQKMVFDVLSQCPQLAWDIFPQRCNQDHGTSTAASFSLPHGEAWPLAELRQALLLLSEVTSVPVKFCFFIDGLDEYSEDRIDLCETVMSFAKSENVKCCVSSRPWNEFETMFGGDQSALLRVHELTQNDIRSFAHDRLTGTPSKKNRVNKALTAGLVDIIAKRAEGVFLWVFLVTRELREGMSNGDTMAELFALLDSVPSELEDYFKHMMESVPRRHRQYMAKTLQIALASKSARPVDFYYAYEHKDDKTDFAWSMTVSRDSTLFDRQSDDYKACKKRINDRCRGLLSFSEDDDVDFIHRTVHSYLMTRSMQDYLNSKIKAAFHPSLAILEAMTFSFRYKLVLDCWYASFNSVDRTIQKWTTCLDCLDGAIAEDKEATFRLMDKFAELEYIASSGAPSRLQDRFDSCFILPRRIMRSIAITDSTATMKSTAEMHFTAEVNLIADFAGANFKTGKTDSNKRNHVKLCSKGTLLASKCLPYVMARLRDNRDYFRADGVSALGVVLSTTADSYDKIGSSVIELLEMGFDPNESLMDKIHSTPWEVFLDLENLRRDDNDDETTLTLYYDTALSFLKSGADKGALEGRYHIARHIIHGICKVYTRPRLLQNLLAAIFLTPLQTKTRLLEMFVFFSQGTEFVDDPWAARAELVEMISNEMIDVSLKRRYIVKWLAIWRKVPDSISPRLKTKADDYLRASLDEEALEESQSEVGDISGFVSRWQWPTIPVQSWMKKLLWI